MTSRLVFRIACELETADGRACPVRFSWIGPDREAPSSEQEARDEATAIARASEIGWWFGTSLIACPQHAAPLALEALDTGETVRG